jgi:hypothetical protein
MTLKEYMNSNSLRKKVMARASSRDHPHARINPTESPTNNHKGGTILPESSKEKLLEELKLRLA